MTSSLESSKTSGSIERYYIDSSLYFWFSLGPRSESRFATKIVIMFLDFKDTKTRSVRAQWAHNHASIPLRHKINHPPDHLPPGLGSWPSPITDDEELPPAPKLKPLKDAASITNPKVAIVGTGASGLFTAMILQYLNKNVPTSAGFNASWDFYEASPSTRGVGGRLYTYNFTDTSPDARHNYFDVGAMRFPDASGNPPSNPIMQR